MQLNSSAETSSLLTCLKDFFLSRDVPAYLVGGCVRDRFLGRPGKDIDLAIGGDPFAIGRELADFIGGTFLILGQDHRAARVVQPRAQTSGRVVDLTPLRGTVHEDLSRRDFTVDAMALPLSLTATEGWADGIIDPFEGREDLARGVIRAVETSVFRDDPVRLMRAVRIAAGLGFSIDGPTRALILRDAHLVGTVAGERVRDELLGIIARDGAKEQLQTLDALGLLCCIIPELDAAKGVDQPREHYWDVFDHSLHTVEAVERVTVPESSDPVAARVPWTPAIEARFALEATDAHTRRTVLKLGGLLHDIAKPYTKTVDATGRTRFLGHHIMGAKMAREVTSRMRLGRRGADMVCSLVEHHLRPTQMAQGGELPTPRAVNRYFRDVGDVAVDNLYLSLADHLAARGPDLKMEGWGRHAATIGHILDLSAGQQQPQRKRKLVTGHDLMLQFGLDPGPLIGELLAGLQDAQAVGEVETREEALAWVDGELRQPALTGRTSGARHLGSAG